MGGAAQRRNPFRPGAGASPPVLSGRETELTVAEERLDALEAGDPPSEGLLFFGPRGNGKTTLLARIAEDARRRGMRAESLAVTALRSSDALIRRLQEKAHLTGTRIEGAQAAGFGLSVEPGSPTSDVGELLAAWIQGATSPLVILLDEAHTIEPGPGGAFFDAVQEATTRALPFLLLTAGTPDAPRRLRRAGTFTERALQRLRVGRLVRAETIRALVQPARASGLPLLDDAARFLAAESQDYPYFIQLLGSAAWKAADAAAASEISMEAARKGTAATRPRIETFYSERFSEARGRGVDEVLAPLAALISEGSGKIGDDALKRLLAREAPAGERARLLETLTDLGVLWETEPAVWELGIPSFAEHILRRQAR